MFTGCLGSLPHGITASWREQVPEHGRFVPHDARASALLDSRNLVQHSPGAQRGRFQPQLASRSTKSGLTGIGRPPKNCPLTWAQRRGKDCRVPDFTAQPVRLRCKCFWRKMIRTMVP